MEARINNSTNNQTAQEILDNYMKQLDERSAEYWNLQDDPDAPDYVVRSMDRTLDRLETLAYLYMGLVTEFKGSRKK